MVRAASPVPMLPYCFTERSESVSSDSVSSSFASGAVPDVRGQTADTSVPPAREIASAFSSSDVVSVPAVAVILPVVTPGALRLIFT